mmetsp:Transcript_32145/g.43895  ORF Transcript_32145/g.43895 Transcript_32145/m.43895 type:complete len:151 (-) Transcript_32145:415-867(-)
MQVELGVLLQIGSIYSSMEGTTLAAWNEAKQRWPEAASSSVSNGEQLLARASFHWALYEQALLRSLQDLLAATTILPGFAQAWRRAGDALSEMRLLRSAMEYYQVAARLDGSLGEDMAVLVERLRVMELLGKNGGAKGLSAEALLSLLDE